MFDWQSTYSSRHGSPGWATQFRQSLQEGRVSHWLLLVSPVSVADPVEWVSVLLSPVVVSPVVPGEDVLGSLVDPVAVVAEALVVSSPSSRQIPPSQTQGCAQVPSMHTHERAPGVQPCGTHSDRLGSHSSSASHVPFA